MRKQHIQGGQGNALKVLEAKVVNALITLKMKMKAVMVAEEPTRIQRQGAAVLRV